MFMGALESGVRCFGVFLISRRHKPDQVMDSTKIKHENVREPMNCNLNSLRDSQVCFGINLGRDGLQYIHRIRSRAK